MIVTNRTKRKHNVVDKVERKTSDTAQSHIRYSVKWIRSLNALTLHSRCISARVHAYQYKNHKKELPRFYSRRREGRKKKTEWPDVNGKSDWSISRNTKLLLTKMKKMSRKAAHKLEKDTSRRSRQRMLQIDEKGRRIEKESSSRRRNNWRQNILSSTIRCCEGECVRKTSNQGNTDWFIQTEFNVKNTLKKN